MYFFLCNVSFEPSLRVSFFTIYACQKRFYCFKIDTQISVINNNITISL